MPVPEASGPEDLAALRAAIPKGVRFGTSSWTYPGWKGLVYQRDYPATGASAEMLAEYARYPLFSTVGIDSSFYGPLTQKSLKSYSAALPRGFPCLSKVWDRITVHTFAKAREKLRAGQPNPDFLNADLFLSDVWGPLQTYFQEHTGPLIFEFQAIARQVEVTPSDFAERLDRFFAKLPRNGRYAVEIRNPEFLTPAYFAVLREHDVSHVLSSWTRMPSIGMQLDLPGVITAGFLVVRALLRPGRLYADAVDAFQPYDRIRDPNPELRSDLVRVVETAEQLRIPAYILVNNRAEGSAPRTIAAVVELLRDR
ncbi:MAG TPA: DUF72 domain-containing protein [Gemmatimonadales bacterium]|nr:DUF72 domain-containing protein [Gemmatimonadales bacterium]